MIAHAAQPKIQNKHQPNRPDLTTREKPKPVDDMCGAPTLSGQPCKHSAPAQGSKCASGHIPANYKKQRITQSTLKQRGWTMAMIRDILGAPDAEVPNPHYSNAAPMKLYYLYRVVEAEKSEAFSAAKIKADKRRASAQKA